MQSVEDDQGEIKTACIQYFLQFFKAMDEENKGVLVGDAFKTVIGKLEEDIPMEAKEVCADWLETSKMRALSFSSLFSGTWDRDSSLTASNLKPHIEQAPWMTPLAKQLIEEAGDEGTIDYVKFVTQELQSPRDDEL